MSAFTSAIGTLRRANRLYKCLLIRVDRKWSATPGRYHGSFESIRTNKMRHG
jgi:hypothetical protein